MTSSSDAERAEIMEIRHSSLYAPRDFDISPYFQVVKPTIERGFDYKSVAWADMPLADLPEAEAEAVALAPGAEPEKTAA